MAGLGRYRLSRNTQAGPVPEAGWGTSTHGCAGAATLKQRLEEESEHPRDRNAVSNICCSILQSLGAIATLQMAEMLPLPRAAVTKTIVSKQEAPLPQEKNQIHNSRITTSTCSTFSGPVTGCGDQVTRAASSPPSSEKYSPPTQIETSSICQRNSFSFKFSQSSWD